MKRGRLDVFGGPEMSITGVPDDFQGVLRRLRAGNEEAAAAIFRRFVHQLTALASRQFDSTIRHRADPEGVVQSVYRSFFARDLRNHFRLDDWESLWALLALITVRKCSKRRKRWRRVRLLTGQDAAGATRAGEEVSPGWFEAIDRAPTPAEAAALTETVSQLFHALDADDRAMAEGILQGYTAVELSERHGCSERTVRRVRARLKERLERLEAEDSHV